MSDNDCLICCRTVIDTSLDVQNAETLFRTLFGHPLEFFSDNSDMDSFQLLFQSATYCSKCVGNVQELGVLFNELEALEKKLDNGKIQIKNQLRQGFVFYEWGANSESVGSHNQKLRKKIVTRLNEQEGTTDPLNTEDQQLPESSIPVFSEVEIPIIADIFSPPSPTHSISSLNSFDEEKFLPEEIPSDVLDQTTPLKSIETPPELPLGDPKMKTRISTGVLKKRFTCDTCEESFQLPSQLKKHKCAFGHDHEEPDETRTEKSERTINTKIRQNDRTTGNASQVSNIDSQCNKRLPVVILHKLSDADTNAARTRMPNKAIHQPKAIKKQGRIKMKEPRTRCPFFPGCITTFGKIDEEIRMRAHVRKHHEGMKNGYLCEVEKCGRSFESLKELRTHESWKHEGIHPYTCSHCEEVCTSEHHLKLHIAVSHKPEDIRFRCEFCDEAFISQRRLTLHLMKHTKKRPFMCEICSKTFNTSQVLKYHQSKHHTEVTPFDPYKCEECGKIFAAPQNLRYHIRRLHTREYKYQCEICGHGAITPSELKNHMNYRHSEDKNFKCEQCGVCYKVKHQLQIHIRTHTGERPFVCKTESCGKAFSDNGKLKRHELIHSNEQCHVCKVCGKTFPVRNYLYIHMRSHNKKKLGEPKMDCPEGNSTLI